MYYRFLSCLLVFFTFFGFIGIAAQEEVYELVDYSSSPAQKIYSSAYYDEAYYQYMANVDDYQNLVLLYNDEVLQMEYGIVEFKSGNSCSLNIEYTTSNKDEVKSLNACYAVDAAYLGQSGNHVLFALGGIIGQTARENVILHPFESLDVRLSLYTVQDGILYHEVKTQLIQDYYTHSIELGPAPDYLIEDTSYYSYDGHYFYADFYAMIDDYLENDHQRSANKDNPYYNYYQYLPHRSVSDYSYAEINDYFTNELCFDRRLQSYDDLNQDGANDIVNASQYYGQLAAFEEYQYIYGANAMMMLAVSIEESSYGKNLRSFDENNLFAHAAFDTEKERNSGRYENVERSVYAHARYYISSRFANYQSSYYNGSFFGNLESGMNVAYSNDPYWGEKVAGQYYLLDAALGQKDYLGYALGIIFEKGEVPIYEDAEKTTSLTVLEDIRNYSFILLGLEGDCYKIQFDMLKDREGHTYDFEDNYAYIDKDDIDIILNEDKIGSKEFVEVTVDANGGTIAGQEVLNLKILKGQSLCLNSVSKPGFLWRGYNLEIEPLYSDAAYIVQYDEVNSIELVNDLPKLVNYNGAYDYRDGQISLTVNGKNRIIDINSDMIEVLEEDDGRFYWHINYAGLELKAEIDEIIDINEKEGILLEEINSFKEQYSKGEAIDIEALHSLKEDLANWGGYLSFDDIRILDALLLANDNYFYHIPKTPLNIGISGFGLSLPYPSNDQKLFKDTYYADISGISYSDRRRLLDVSSAYGFVETMSFYLSFRLNLQSVENINPFIVQVQIPSSNTGKIYSVYRLDDDGNVIKCRSSQSRDYLQFITDKSGSFMILEMPSANNYDLENHLENVTSNNCDLDLHGAFLSSMGVIALGMAIIIAYLNYERLEERKERLWNVYKKSLPLAVYVPEEKPKN